MPKTKTVSVLIFTIVFVLSFGCISFAAEDGISIPVRINLTGAYAPEETFVIILEGEGLSEEKDIALSSINNTKNTSFTLPKKAGWYKVREKKGQAEFFTYSEKIYHIHITVEPDGSYKTHITEEGSEAKPGEILFENSYEADNTDEIMGDPPVRIKKRIKGNPPEEEIFTFVMKPDDPAYPLPENSTVTIKGEGEVEISRIRFTGEGTYSYTVTEINDGKKGWNYDPAVYRVTYYVTRSQSGSLSCRREIIKDGKESVDICLFVNYYGNAASSRIKRGVQTGDPMIMIPITIIFAGSVIALALLNKKKKHDEDKKD